MIGTQLPPIYTPVCPYTLYQLQSGPMARREKENSNTAFLWQSMNKQEWKIYSTLTIEEFNRYKYSALLKS